MREIRLSSRLETVASFIPQGARVADIGTDHGFLPIWLVQKSICSEVIACDVREGPLSQARRFACEYGVEDKISFKLGYGLTPVEPYEVDTIVIAGMGGETIKNILSAAPWIKEGDYTLILQPQSKLPELIRWLNESQYAVTNGRLAEDDGRIYLVIEVKRGHAAAPSISELYVPKVLEDSADTLLSRYVSTVIDKLGGVVKAIDSSDRPGEKQKVKDMEETIEQLLLIIRRVECADSKGQ